MLRLSVSHTWTCCRSTGSAAPPITFDWSASKLKTSLWFGLIDSFRVFSWFCLARLLLFASPRLGLAGYPGIYIFFSDVESRTPTHLSGTLSSSRPEGPWGGALDKGICPLKRGRNWSSTCVSWFPVWRCVLWNINIAPHISYRMMMQPTQPTTQHVSNCNFQVFPTVYGGYDVRSSMFCCFRT